ncbi:hypothetical protein N9W41_00770, partial [bacterium]|nr:hypothetical protein [bacterium]
TVKGRSAAWRESAIGKYSMKVLRNRLKKAKINSGKKIRQHLLFIKNELFDLFEQSGFIKFEMLKGKKKIAQMETAEDSSKESESNVQEDKQRHYYIQNGYEYWPFQGEYWLDEIGNYHYLGKSSCEALSK